MHAQIITYLLLGTIIVNSNCFPGTKDAPPASRIVFKHGKVSGDYERFKTLLKAFEKNNPGIVVEDEALPASTDEQHQFYVINFEGGRADFDVVSMDVIWVPEFSRAGWLLDITDMLSEKEKAEFFPGPIRAVTYRNRLYAVPWYIDAGLLFFRKDLLAKYGLSPPETWQDLVSSSLLIMSTEPGVHGFIWQGKQYEGLVCNALEYLWSNNGDVLRGERVAINSPENIRALRFMRDLIARYGVSPSLVTTSSEEPCRHIFGNGRAVFMRNWPYAWNLFNAEKSPVKGRVGITTLPSFRKGASQPVLGGWQLGINRHTKHPAEARALVRFLTSPESQKMLFLAAGYYPARKSLYRDRELMLQQSFLPELYRLFMKARPRPVTPYYMMLSQVLQPEFSAVVAGLKTPEDALASAQKQIEHILEAEYDQ
ncbi:MAG: ABC transporter substrate-binding protein [Spirochaetes bacterium]|nr:ABC transporter substrate-binding protein [Spirochaetota bacterium]